MFTLQLLSYEPSKLHILPSCFLSSCPFPFVNRFSTVVSSDGTLRRLLRPHKPCGRAECLILISCSEGVRWEKVLERSFLERVENLVLTSREARDRPAGGLSEEYGLLLLIDTNDQATPTTVQTPATKRR
ncbi:MAG: hypothetical protein FRX48_04788 [Lasallia pustulata]|uniref:Uncharacterized protein n=1 Tax=Lasallia pustulata TaxID=136370 RepID=A0A5M8PPP9_9LECA|nr:MAG: hypothetical protein FRX48_04788 [Lasallia pustulata]